MTTEDPHLKAPALSARGHIDLTAPALDALIHLPQVPDVLRNIRVFSETKSILLGVPREESNSSKAQQKAIIVPCRQPNSQTRQVVVFRFNDTLESESRRLVLAQPNWRLPPLSIRPQMRRRWATDRMWVQ